MFGTYDIVDGPSERMSVRTIPLSGYMDICSRYTPEATIMKMKIITRISMCEVGDHKKQGN